jgi:hypothetical protein
MKGRAWHSSLALLVALVAIPHLTTSVSWADPCDDPSDISSNPRRIPNCVMVDYGPYGFTKFQHTQRKNFCAEPNSLFLSNAYGYPGYWSFEVDNICFSFWVHTPEFDDELETLAINWRDKSKIGNLSLGCLPGDLTSMGRGARTVLRHQAGSYPPLVRPQRHRART